jgi:hypothetical protein
MLKQNKLTTYFLYAIGEILLVVCGILIAVQIDNWNQDKKITQNISIGVEFMIEELRKDSISIMSGLESHRIRAEKNDSLYQRIHHPLATFDTVLHIMKLEYVANWATHFDYNSTAYENMKSSGTFDLLPDSIKSAIHHVYGELASASEIMRIFNIQYREPMEEYVKRYTINRDTSSLVFKTAWSNVDPQHFIPRAWWMVFTRNILFGRYVVLLEEHEQNNIELIEILTRYQNNPNH